MRLWIPHVLPAARTLEWNAKTISAAVSFVQFFRLNLIDISGLFPPSVFNLCRLIWCINVENVTMYVVCNYMYLPVLNTFDVITLINLHGSLHSNILKSKINQNLNIFNLCQLLFSSHFLVFIISLPLSPFHSLPFPCPGSNVVNIIEERRKSLSLVSVALFWEWRTFWPQHYHTGCP